MLVIGIVDFAVAHARFRRLIFGGWRRSGALRVGVPV
jgi:hypothetical protein